MTLRKGRPSLDNLPEHYEYRDTGCEVAPSCLRCPLEVCRHDEVDEGGYPITTRRDTAVLERYAALVRGDFSGTIGDIAREMEVSYRTVLRIVEKRQREDPALPTVRKRHPRSR